MSHTDADNAATNTAAGANANANAAADAAANANAAEERLLVVEGMSCQHCEAAVTEELSALDGVEVLAADSGIGEVRIRTSGAASNEALASAVDEAGFTLRDIHPAR